MKKVQYIILQIILSVFFWAGNIFANNSSYKIIETQQEFEEIVVEAKKMLRNYFAISLRYPVNSFLVSAQKLDELYQGAYRGAQVGFYRFIGGCHEIYVMKDTDRDDCLGTTAHELVHAWQTEYCPKDQDIIVKEGFARWVQYKLLDKVGAYVKARNLFEHADPVYGVGFKKMLEWEDQLGEIGVVLKQQKVRSISDQ